MRMTARMNYRAVSPPEGHLAWTGVVKCKMAQSLAWERPSSFFPASCLNLRDSKAANTDSRPERVKGLRLMAQRRAVWFSTLVLAARWTAAR